MPKLIVISDPLTGARREFTLTEGETVGRALMRLWPAGIDGAWRIYRDEATDECELAAVDLPYVVALEGETYILVRTPLGPLPSWAVQLIIAVVLSAISYVLTPKPRTPKIGPPEESGTGTNQLAGQSNQLRLGARIPEILGRVRCYPDLLCAPIETWFERTQNIQQFFIVGMGYYDIPLDSVKLGETPITTIGGASFTQFDPGVPSQIRAVRESPEVRGISLMADDGGVIPVIGVTFNAAAKTMSSPTYIELPADVPVTIDGTNFNNGDRWLVSVPPSSGSPPFVYQLDGPIVDESGSNPVITVWEATSSTVWSAYLGTSSPLAPTPTPQDARIAMNETLAVGDVVKYEVTSGSATGSIYRGTLHYAQKVLVGVMPVTRFDTITRMTNPNGAVVTFPNADAGMLITVYTRGTGGGSGGGGGDPPPAGNPVPTGWYTAPMENPTEIWVDISFRNGLISFVSGERNFLWVDVRVEFRRAGATDPQASREVHYQYRTQGPLRFTQQFSVASLGLPAGSPWIQVRVTKVTANRQDTSTTQYIEETTWERLAAMRQLPALAYEGVTTCALALANTRNAVAMGETTVNMVVTRKLESWTGSGWTARAPTVKWADNFVARCKAADGAQRTDAQIDLAGIYALQAQLDAMDGGDQGEIGLALDQVIDIDAELVAIADIVRAVVYRVGRKIFVSRDQATSTRIALFNARTKHPDGETVGVRMTGDAENDCVLVPWVDEAQGFKRREYKYPEGAIEANPHRVSTPCANWAQARRRAVFEWNRLKYRREAISVSVTEEGRICRPGDVVNITDDVANLAETAGEVLYVSGNVLTLDRDVSFSTGTYTILLRDVYGQTTDAVPCVAVAGSPNRVQLSRAPTVAVKGRDENLGTMFAFYNNAAANVRPWLLTAVEASGGYVALTGVNYSSKVYDGDTGTLPPVPPILSAALDATSLPPPEVSE